MRRVTLAVCWLRPRPYSILAETDPLMTASPQPAPAPAPVDDVLPRWNRIWSAVFVLSLLAPLVIAWWVEDLSPPELLLAAGLAGAALLAHGLIAYYLPSRQVEVREHTWLLVGYIALIIALWYGLVSIHGVFNFFLAGVFSQMFFWLPIWLSIPAGLLFSAALALQEAGVAGLSWSSLGRPTVVIWVFVALAGVVLAAFINAILRQSMRRQALIHELQATQDELASVERRAGVLAERQRLAHEIHDTLAQGFTSIVMHLEAAEQALPGDEATVRRHLDFARRTARESLEQARRVVQDLQPQQLEQATLPEAIERVATIWSEETGIDARVAVTGAARPLPPEWEVTLLRTAQEALANIRRHASAHQTSLTLSYMPDLVVLDVQDDGVGVAALPAAAGPEGGFGLQAMRERVTQLGGTLLVESAPGEGTTLVVELPA